MPTYEYQCKECGHRFDRFQPITDPPLQTCPECSGTVERLISTGGGLIFKGSGFYITDYRSPEYQKQAKKESGGDTSETSAGAKEKTEKKSSGESTKTETKSSKTETKNTKGSDG